MIAQARITSDTGAVVHLAEETVAVEGADLPEVRSGVKQVFIAAARSEDSPLDVVIVEPDVHHHLRVEPSGRISPREADDRALFGPALDAPWDAHEDHEGRPATPWSPPAGTPTGELPSVHPKRARRRRAAAMPPSSGSAASAGSSPVITSIPSGSTGSSAGSADSSHSAHSAHSAPSPSPVPAPSTGRPTLQDLQTSTARPRKVKAAAGWQGLLTRATGGLISPRPGRTEQYRTDRLARIRTPLDGPRNIVVVNLKGGAHKTTTSLMIAATLGVTRGGNVLAWDNNETRGTLGWRGIPTDHHRTAVDLLHDLDRLRSPQASAADLDPYTRPQGAMRFDILASDEDPGSSASIDGEAFDDLNDALSRFYRIKVIDTGNNVRASNWLAAVHTADQLVIVSTVREDTFNAAAWMIDELRATGLEEQVDHAVTILSHSAKGKVDPVLRQRLVNHFGSHTRAVTEVPYEQQFVDGSHLDWDRVSAATKEAWLDATALIIDGL